jgi:hypothetical protein
MDAESQTSSASSVYFSRVKRGILILAFASVVVLEVYTLYSVSPSSDSVGGGGVGKFVCSEDIRVGEGLHVKICNKLINIFKNFNSTTSRAAVSLTESEWEEVGRLLKR